LISHENMSDLAAAIAGAQCVTIGNAGHLVNLDQPERFDRLVKDFFSVHPCRRNQ
jgi:pimeloyl-ACP methyl ester carboxylesterase